MIANKPSIFIYVNDPDRIYMEEICAGIEEEGVLYTVVKREETNASRLASEAANDSMLGSGLGICGSQVVMQMKGLAVADIKTTSVLDKEYLVYQLNLYRIGLEQSYDYKIDSLYGIHLRDGKRKLVPIPIVSEEELYEKLKEVL